MSSAEPLRGTGPDSPFVAASTRSERLRLLRSADILRGVQALVLLPIAAVVLRRWGLQSVQRRLADEANSATRQIGSDPTAIDEARRLAWVVDGVARRGPWKGNCLQRSLLLWWFLLRRGFASEIRIGVRRRPGTRDLDFHAWVECDGVVMNERADVRERFATFDRAIAPRHADWS